MSGLAGALETNADLDNDDVGEGDDDVADGLFSSVPARRQASKFDFSFLRGCFRWDGERPLDDMPLTPVQCCRHGMARTM